MELSRTQKFVKWFSSKAKFEKIIEESKQWIFKCECGKTTSIWDMGGVRSGAKGNPKIRLKCPHCQKVSWQIIYKEN